jgi:hypothetical protein
MICFVDVYLPVGRQEGNTPPQLTVATTQFGASRERRHSHGSLLQNGIQLTMQRLAQQNAECEARKNEKSP